jgi:hypothetical protein
MARLLQIQIIERAHALIADEALIGVATTLPWMRTVLAFSRRLSGR